MNKTKAIKRAIIDGIVDGARASLFTLFAGLMIAIPVLAAVLIINLVFGVGK